MYFLIKTDSFCETNRSTSKTGCVKRNVPEKSIFKIYIEFYRLKCNYKKDENQFVSKIILVEDPLNPLNPVLVKLHYQSQWNQGT